MLQNSLLVGKPCQPNPINKPALNLQRKRTQNPSSNEAHSISSSKSFHRVTFCQQRSGPARQRSITAGLRTVGLRTTCMYRSLDQIPTPDPEVLTRPRYSPNQPTFRLSTFVPLLLYLNYRMPYAYDRNAKLWHEQYKPPDYPDHRTRPLRFCGNSFVQHT